MTVISQGLSLAVAHSGLNFKLIRTYGPMVDCYSNECSSLY